jgi:hypothetical protein
MVSRVIMKNLRRRLQSWYGCQDGPRIGVPAINSQAQVHLVIDKNETIGKPLELVDPSVRAILLKRLAGVEPSESMAM